jgi:hypothetical protein
MPTTLIPDTPDASVDSVDEATVIDFKEIPTTAQRPSARQWWLVGGVIGGSIALATVATVVANLIATRPTVSRQLFGTRPMRRYGLRHVATPRGGTAWLAYTYRLPDLRVQLPEMALRKLTLPKMASLTARGRHR